MIYKLIKYKQVLGLGILLFSLLLISGCTSTKVQTVQEETEANEIIDILRENGIVATKEEAGEGNKKFFNIYVQGGDVEYGAAIQLMEDHCLPQPKPQAIESSGLVPSGEVEKARDLQRMKINMEAHLRNLPGTTCVSVTLGQLDDKQMTLDPDPTTATVLVKYKTESLGLNNKQIAGMVAGGITGLEADKVFVTLTKQPLRPLPNFESSRNLQRIILVGGIGLVTILAFLGIVFYMRNKRVTPQIDELADDEQDLIDDGETDENDVLQSDANLEIDGEIETQS